MKICVMTGTRADYGLLRLLLQRMKQDEDIELNLLVTGAHLSEQFGNTKDEILEDRFTFDEIIIPVNNDSRVEMACSLGETLVKTSRYLHDSHPDMLILLGDRYEAFAVAAVAYILSIPIAHISGGDVTEGALDDGFRHCITKMSTIHFPGCYESAKRIIQMGENPENVYCIGDPGVESCKKADFWDLNRLQDNLGIHLVGKQYGVVTFHPVTQRNDSIKQLAELINALELYENVQFIITTANADAEGVGINEVWKEKAKTHNNWLVIPSLGQVRYLSAVKYASVVIGNSSSGIVEAPALGVPTVNIGDRQKGRMMADSVISCDATSEAIDDAISRAISDEFQHIAKMCESPYGKGETSKEIVRVIKERLGNGSLSAKKSFFDINFEVCEWKK